MSVHDDARSSRRWFCDAWPCCFSRVSLNNPDNATEPLIAPHEAALPQASVVLVAAPVEAVPPMIPCKTDQHHRDNCVPANMMMSRGDHGGGDNDDSDDDDSDDDDNSDDDDSGDAGDNDRGNDGHDGDARRADRLRPLELLLASRLCASSSPPPPVVNLLRSALAAALEVPLASLQA